MTVVTDRASLATARAALTGTVALVPTMGALHEGHLSLVRSAKAAGADHVIVSIFVNPLQFAPGEDFETYPRDLDADVTALRSEGVSLVFAPTREVMYSHRVRVTVSPGPVAGILEGASRPGFFDGVLTVVTKLFHLTTPDIAVFGEKDYQQLTLIRQLVTDLDFGIDIVGAPTVRDADGLAKSSRNAYLSTPQRELALTLSRALHAGAADTVDPLGAASTVISDAGDAVELDYLELTSPDLGEPVAGDQARLLVAATVGSTRLIDNIAVTLSPEFTAHSSPRVHS